MARSTKRLRTAHETTAAYAASQPLFDALRSGVNRTDEQHALLSNARDTVQQTHVKLADAISDGNTDHNKSYVGNIVKAWRSATLSYVEIFDALAEASAAEPSAGTPAREGYAQFVKMARTAKDATNVAMEFVLSEEKQVRLAEASAQENESEDEVKSETNAFTDPDDHKDIQALQKQLDDMQRALRGTDQQANIRQRLEESKQKHEKKLLALRAKKKQAQEKPTTNGTSAASAEPTSILPEATPKVEYEDVSAQVEARLKAKRDKREAAKKEKKRKRESGDSNGFGIPKAGDTAAVVEKPVKKKSKANGVATEEDVVATKEKRRKSSGAADAGEDGRWSKKAKTRS